MRRRNVIALLGGAAAWPLAVRAQQPAARVYRVGYLNVTTREQQIHLIRAFEGGLRSLGYRVDQNVIIEYRFANGELQRLPALAADLVQLGMDIIVCGNNPSTVAVMKATTTIPIVMTSVTDPVQGGLVASLARPGGNVTGFSLDGGIESETQGKRLQLLKEILPNLTRLGVLLNPDFAVNLSWLQSMKDVTQPMGIKLVAVEARGLDELETAFATMVKEQTQAFILLTNAVLFNYRQQIGVMAVSNSLPSISSVGEYAEAGLLLAYGANLRDLYSGAATFIDKIFKGATPGDLPVEQPTKFELVVNLKTSKALGLTVPPTLLARADQVIE
jgi:ABC-type uncharacterized transport system substrate-binding protein